MNIKEALEARRVLWILVLLPLQLVGCDPSPTAERALGIQKTADAFAIRYLPCPGDHVQRVRVIAPMGDDPYDGDDQMIWEIRADRATTTTRFELGTTPEGFEETTPVRDVPLDELVVHVEGPADAGMWFSMDELPPDKILTGEGDALATDVFRKRARAPCL